MDADTFRTVVLPVVLGIVDVALFILRNEVAQAFTKEDLIQGMWMFWGKGRLIYAKILVYLLIVFLLIFACALPFIR